MSGEALYQNKTKEVRKCNRRHKQLICPNCGSRLIDEGINTDTELWVVSEENDFEADYYAKCRTCKHEIGIKKLNR